MMIMSFAAKPRNPSNCAMESRVPSSTVYLGHGGWEAMNRNNDVEEVKPTIEWARA